MGETSVPSITCAAFGQSRAGRATDHPVGAARLAAVPLLAVGTMTLSVQHGQGECLAGSSRHFQLTLGMVRAHHGPLVITGSDRYQEEVLSLQRYTAGPRPAGQCGEVVFVEGGGTGRCPTVYVIRGIPLEHP